MNSLPVRMCAYVFAMALAAASASSMSSAGLAQVSGGGAAGPGTANASGEARAYADEPVVIEHVDHVFSMAADGTGRQERTFVARLQSDAAVKKYGVLTVPYASSSEHVELEYARSRHPDGTVAETQVADAMDIASPVTRQAPFYSDLKELELPIRNLRVGDTLELKYRIVRTKAEVPGQFWGQETFPDNAVILSQTTELRVPAGMAVNVWSPSVKPTESTSEGSAGAPAQHVYRWSFAQLKPTAGKEAEAAAAAKKKMLWTASQEVDGEQGKLPTIAWTTFKTWEAVGAWYRSLEADRAVADETVKAKAAELTAGRTTDEAKAHALYDYVATNIRYIGVAFGIGRYQPHTAAEILSNQYGDCKDKHTLLAALLAAEGISSDAVLIGPGIRFNPDVPSPAAFNHLITRLVLGGKPVWLDTTAEVAPWGMLVSVTRDKQALVIPMASSSVAAIVRTPLEPVVASVVTMDAVGSLDANGVSTSHLVLSFRGDGEMALRAAFRQLPPDKYDQVVQAISKGIGFTGTTSSPEISRAVDTTRPFKIDFDYKREKAGDWEHLKTIPQVMPVVLPRVTEIDPPVHAIQLGTPHTEDSTSSMKLPDGWTAVLPAAIHARCEYGTYDMTYRLEGGTVYADRHVETLAKRVPVSDWKAYKEWVDKVNPGREAYIQLVILKNSMGGSKSITSGSDASGAIQPAVKSPELRTKQIEDALRSGDAGVKNNVAYALALNNDHLADAQLLAEQAVQLKEQQVADNVSGADPGKAFEQMVGLSRFWDTTGFVYYHARRFDAAERYLRAAWELNPNSVFATHLGLVYQTEKKFPEAIAMYRMALSAKPSDTAIDAIQSRLTTLSAPSDERLPIDIATPLQTLRLTLAPGDDAPLMDVVLSHGHAASVTWLKGDKAIKKVVVDAVQTALASSLPDDGPELVIRRAQLACEETACSLHFTNTREFTVAEQARRKE